MINIYNRNAVAVYMMYGQSMYSRVVRSARVADPRNTSLQSLRPGGGFNRSSKLKVRAARG